MADIISWVATAATIIAASMTASNLGARITGYGFIVFLVGSIAWLTTGVMTNQPALMWTNVVLTALNIFGIWRWLGREARVEEGARRPPRRAATRLAKRCFPSPCSARRWSTGKAGSSVRRSTPWRAAAADA
ncbi:hypothetical protein H9L13_08315 [Sphingomonas lutea]|uniref:YgjV family protein n=1 Tax=Sphingomonas lutea TaxID=1045317 RepID=A0A7G9SLF7_9SPHN|nr:hypothetical protein [Sphingomonas lutea]QNN68682.1 hypothetical protein H9L13_08315 [Sphingomonas lutea]